MFFHACYNGPPASSNFRIETMLDIQKQKFPNWNVVMSPLSNPLRGKRPPNTGSASKDVQIHRRQATNKEGQLYNIFVNGLSMITLDSKN